jgi:hypothetical protein
MPGTEIRHIQAGASGPATSVLQGRESWVAEDAAHSHALRQKQLFSARLRSNEKTRRPLDLSQAIGYKGGRLRDQPANSVRPRRVSMKLDFSKTIAALAVAGLTGLVACGGSTPEPATPEAPAAESAEAAESAPAADGAAAPAADGATATAAGKECCKGMNECKGKGGCAVEGKHECKANNECKGQGGCNGHCPK